MACPGVKTPEIHLMLSLRTRTEAMYSRQISALTVYLEIKTWHPLCSQIAM